MKTIIKLITLTLSIVFVFSCASTISLSKQGINLIEGADLFYKVKTKDDTYDFCININHFGKHISFDYYINLKRGTIYMDENTLNNATDLYNYFDEGYKELTKKTSVWLSKKLFNDLKAGKSVTIGLQNNSSEKELFTLVDSKTYSFGKNENGKPYKIPIIFIATNDNKKEIWIADDPNNRLIVFMNIGLRIDLIGFKPYK